MTVESPAILLGELSAADARAVFDRFLTDRPPRLNAFLHEVERRGGPADRLDHSIQSLEPLWGWFVEEHRPRRWFAGPHRMPSSPVADAVMRDSDPPWWYAYHPQFAQALGPYLARLVTGLTDYYFACALMARPSSRWALGKGRSYAYFQHPVFQLEGRGERDYAFVIVVSLQALRGERNQEPDALRRHLERWIGMDPAYEAEMERLSRPVGEFGVSQIEHQRFTHQLTFDDVVAHRAERRIARLVELLSAEAGIDEAAHEDRETVLVSAPALSASDLERVAARLWKRVRRSHADLA